MRLEIKVKKFELIAPQNGLIGFVDFSINDEWAFNSIAVFLRPDWTIRLAWPEKKRGMKKIRTAFPLNVEIINSIESQIFQALKNDAGFKDATEALKN
jgi:hypothetical protein